MTPRHLRIDFSGLRLDWSPQAEFAAILNSGSPLTSAVEPYLNMVMMRARDALGEDHAALRRQIDLFVRQEAYHYRLHDGFNRELYAAGYADLKALADRLKAELRIMLDERPLAWNLAYCTGFENMATFMAKFVFGPADDLFDGADPRAAALWKWHMAEEFEHRSACHDVLTAIAPGYRVRIGGFVAAMRHLFPYNRAATAIVLAQDRAGMTPEERRRSIAREKAYQRRFGLFMLRRMTAILKPGYDPADHVAPPGLDAALEAYGEIARQRAPADVKALRAAVDL